MAAQELPKFFYKYRRFNENTLRILGMRDIYYADPDQFNDPLDCSPLIVKDINNEDLQRLWRRMAAENNPLGELGVGEMLSRHEKSYTYPTKYEKHYADGEIEAAILLEKLETEISTFFFKELGDKGVLSLATTSTCPLMWSHYADEHRGICIAFASEENSCESVAPVNYASSRYIRLSEIFEWKVNHSDTAREKVLNQYFFAKAPNWSYENEWRDISPDNGSRSSPFKEITGVYFGLRCPDVVVMTVWNMLASQADRIGFYKVHDSGSGFDLSAVKFAPADSPEYRVKGTTSPSQEDNVGHFLDFEDDIPF
jgi:hypothetical protein